MKKRPKMNIATLIVMMVVGIQVLLSAPSCLARYNRPSYIRNFNEDEDEDAEIYHWRAKQEAKCTRSGLCGDMWCSSCCILRSTGAPHCINDAIGNCGNDLTVEEIPSENLCGDDGKIYFAPSNLAYASCGKNRVIKVIKKGNCKPGYWGPIWGGGRLT